MNIIDFIPFGHDHAISRIQLCRLFGTSDRRMRNEIEHARRDYAILNNQDGSGYFRPNPDEKPLAERWLAQERSRGRAIGKSTLGAERFLAGEDDGKTVSVHGYVRRKKKADLQIEGQVTL